MEKKPGIFNASERDGVEYRKASILSMIMGMAYEGVGVITYLLIGFATMAGTQGFGIATITVGALLSVCRIWAGVSDAIVAVVFEKINPRFGKIRLFMVVGWSICAFGLLLLYNIAGGHVDGVMGIVMFVISYLLYDLGSTIRAVGGGTTAVVITNDPTQRPMTTAIGTAYSYGIPMILTTIISFVLLPKYDNQYTMDMFAEMCLIFLAISAVLLVISVIGVWKVDRPEIFAKMEQSEAGKKRKEKQNVTLKDMLLVLKDNRAMQCHIITNASDKLAQQTASQSVISTLMNGVLIGSYTVTTAVGNVSNIIGMAFLLLGGLTIAKWGAKKTTTLMSWISIGISAFAVVFFLFLGGPEGMSKIGVMGLPMLLYGAILVARNGANMVLLAATGARGADITDYEYMRSGNYMPAVISSANNLCEKIISSFGALVATACIALVGYVNTVPQQGDKATWGIFWVAMFLNFGMQVIGWLLNVIAMKFYPLDKDKMIEVQKTLVERKKTLEK